MNLYCSIDVNEDYYHLHPQHLPVKRQQPCKIPSLDLQPQILVTHNRGGGVGKEGREDLFSYRFRDDWKRGPQSSTQEKIERFLSLTRGECREIAIPEFVCNCEISSRSGELIPSISKPIGITPPSAPPRGPQLCLPAYTEALADTL